MFMNFLTVLSQLANTQEKKGEMKGLSCNTLQRRKCFTRGSHDSGLMEQIQSKLTFSIRFFTTLPARQTFEYLTSPFTEQDFVCVKNITHLCTVITSII